MRQTVNVPKLGDTADEIVILEWLVAEGDEIAEGQPVVRVETEKIDTEVESPVAGVVVELLVAVDDEVETGAPLFVVDSSAA